ncbi:MAG: hypothetical protein MUO21_03545, partial [Nitrososphaeraceae archaeon]|nr:hypothetical protein [Nitrososphaeraceae archaeon]
LIVTEENPISKIKQILDLSSIIVPDYNIKVLVLTSPYYRIRIEGDFDECQEITNKIKNQINQNSNNIKSILNICDPKVEKEATRKIKYYGDYILTNFSF